MHTHTHKRAYTQKSTRLGRFAVRAREHAIEVHCAENVHTRAEVNGADKMMTYYYN
jgi:hypothetical protein